MNLDLSQTNEIAKIKKVDPLGITKLRIRGMWSIAHPNKVFTPYLHTSIENSLKAIMTEENFFSLNKNLLNSVKEYLTITNIKVQNPNNPAKLMNAIIIEYNW